jgi:Ca2+-binding EF-hand superfamily protein
VNSLCRSLETLKHPNIGKSVIRGPLTFPNGDQECDFEYFIKLIEDTLSDPSKFEKALDQTFKMMDIQMKGAINSEDLIKISEVLNENISSDEEAVRILQRAESASGESRISKESLKTFLKNDLDRNYIP